MQKSLRLRQVFRTVPFLTLTLFPSCAWQTVDKVDVAPVSGTVTLDGQAVEDVKVLFVPIDRQEGGSRLPLAFAVTDAEGRYTLAHTGGENGAVVGRNQVWLSTRRVARAKEAESQEAETTSEEKIPAKYNRSTELVFDVPVEGTKNADFDLQSE